MNCLYSMCLCRLVFHRRLQCHVYSMLHRERESLQQFQWRQFYQWDDSLSRHWYFCTDSPFIYYPDSVLIGHSGYIWLDENRFRSSTQQLERDSSLYESNSHTEQQKEVKRNGRGMILALLLSLLLFVGVCLYRKAWTR